MSLMQAIIVFGVSWWLLLLMILPIGFKPDPNPAAGHAASAPKSFNLKKKLKVTTLISAIVTMLIYQLLTMQAEAKIYRAGSDCAPLKPHQPAANVHVTDGQGVHGTRVKTANINHDNATDKALRYIDVPLELPLTDYIDNGQFNANLGVTNIRPGTITLDRGDNSVRFNGVNLSDAPLYNPDCISDKEENNIYSTK